MTKDRRTWTAEQKLQTVLPIIRGEVSLSEQARRLKVNENQVYRWRDQANQALLEAFQLASSTGSRERELADHERMPYVLPRNSPETCFVQSVQHATRYGSKGTCSHRFSESRKDSYPMHKLR